ncbi:MAG: hypothetical protein IIA87_03300 [Nanoarchaeota archaeon]|nr:hypothetical protein [Nanoarchaeota archaeon]
MEKFDKNLEGHKMLRKIVIDVKKCSKKEAEKYIDNLIYTLNKTVI